MPRSTNPQSYGALYWDLLTAITSGVSPLVIDVPANEAQKIRFNYWAFVRALEAQGTRERKRGQMALAAQREREANELRSYMVVIEINGETVSQVANNHIVPAKLLFIDRDMNPDTLDAHAQLKEQMKDIDISISTEIGAAIAPVVDFFTTPLEIKDDGDTGDNAEDPSA